MLSPSHCHFRQSDSNGIIWNPAETLRAFQSFRQSMLPRDTRAKKVNHMPTRYIFANRPTPWEVWIAVEFYWEPDDCRSLTQGWWWLAVAPCEYLPSVGCLPGSRQIIRCQMGTRPAKEGNLCLADVTSVANLWLWCGCGGSSAQERCGGWVGLFVKCLSITCVFFLKLGGWKFYWIIRANHIVFYISFSSSLSRLAILK